MNNDTISPRKRRFLSADALIKTWQDCFASFPDPRTASHITHSLVDSLMSAFAMFSLKDPSLLAFDDRQDDASLKNVFGIKTIPSDSQMRDILDPLEIDQLNEAFADIPFRDIAGETLRMPKMSTLFRQCSFYLVAPR